MRLSHLKISTRLIILISVLSIMLISISGIGRFGISQTNDALRQVDKVVTSIRYVTDIMGDQAQRLVVKVFSV